MITVDAVCDRGEKYSLTMRQREPIYSITSPTGGVIARSDHLSSFEDASIPFEVLLRLSIEITKAMRPLVQCAGDVVVWINGVERKERCGEVYCRVGFDHLEELDDGPFDHGISVRACRKCGTVVAAPRA